MGKKVEIPKRLMWQIEKRIWEYVRGDCSVADVIREVLSAVRDGRVKLPGEVGRKDYYEDMDDIFDWIDDILGENPHMVTMPLLIALSPAGIPEEGTKSTRKTARGEESD